MLTKTFEYYAINTTDNEYDSSDKELFDTLKDAFEARMRYSNWYCRKGDVYICHYRIEGSSIKSLDEYRIFESESRSEYQMSQKKTGEYILFKDRKTFPVSEFIKREVENG